MPTKKESLDKNSGQAHDEPLRPELNDLEAHISQRMVELADASSTGEPSIPGALGVDTGVDVDSIIPAFDQYHGFEFGHLDGAPAGFAPDYERIRASYQESGEILKGIHNLSDLLTESILNLNARLNELDHRLQEITEIQHGEIAKLKALLTDVHKALPAARGRQGGPAGSEDRDSQADTTPDLQKLVQPLRERMDRNTVELAQRLDERQTAFVNVLETRLKVMERLTNDYKGFVNKNFFNLCLLVMIVMLIASAIISNSVDRMATYLCQQMDALRLTVERALEPGSTP